MAVSVVRVLLFSILMSPVTTHAQVTVPLQVWGIDTGSIENAKTWRFRQSNADDDLQSANAANPALDDGRWQIVDLRWRDVPGPAVANHFRKQFTLDDIGVTLAQVRGMEVSLQYDDTAVMYLNGVEVYRSIRGNLDAAYANYPPGANIPHDVEVPFGGFENFYVDIPNTNNTNTCEISATCHLSPYGGPNPPAVPVSLLREGVNTWSITTWTRSVGGSGDSSLNHTFTLLIDETAASPAPVSINEVMASNDTTFGVSFDGGELAYPDWIELHNYSDAPVSLNGWNIADNSASWTFPDVSIPARGYLVIVANDEDRKDTSPLQTNFKLSTDGDQLRLTDADGFLVDEYATIPLQSTDAAYGRPADDPDSAPDYLSSPTPGESNAASTSGVAPTLAFFVDRLYNEGEAVSLQVDAFDPDGGPLTYALSPEPPGLGIDNDGLISGTATTPGVFASRLSVTDSDSNTTVQDVLFNVFPRVSNPPALILNEFNAVAPDRQLSTSGGVDGNGGNWFEFVVVENQLDLRGMTIEFYDYQGSDDQLRLASSLTFTSDSRLQPLPAGAIVTISQDNPTDLSIDAITDWHINFQVDAQGNGDFFEPGDGEFDSTHNDQAVVIKNSAGEFITPLMGETAAWDDANGGVSSRETMTLCTNPDSNFTLDPIQHYQDLGTASSFGLENSCPDAGDSAFIQDLSSLRQNLQTFTVTAAIANGGDDAEERASGDMYISSSDIELTRDGGTQIIGLRFVDIDVPAGAVIENATIQFQVDEVNTTDTQLTITAQASPSASAFADRDNNISSRSRSTASVDWSPPPWTVVGQRGADQRTPDLSSVVQSVVDQAGWTTGQSIVFIITGNGERTAESFEGDPSAAARLHIEYTTDANLPPIARMQANPVTGNLPLLVSFTTNGSSDDGAIERYDWDLGDGTLRNDTAAGISHTYNEAGTYTASVTITDDGGKQGTASITISVIDPSQPVIARSIIRSGNDDAEERASGDMYLNSSDIELTEDGGTQTNGLRFNDISVPKTAIIERAYIQFQVDEVNAGTTQLNISAQDAASASSFSNNDNNISSRRLINTSVDWNPPAWTNIGEQSTDQRTPDLSSVVQAVVNRPDWSQGNSMAFIISGSGERTAESFDGDPAAAASLHIHYTTDGNLPPVAAIGADPVSGDFPLTVSFNTDGARDDGTITRYDWQFGDGTSTNDGAANVSHTYTAAGIYNATVTITDNGGKSHSASIVINVTDPNPPPIVETATFTIAKSSDDAEERADSSMYLNSTDIELTEDRDQQLAGLRFTDVSIPRGAVIQRAVIQFTTDEVSTGDSELQIAIQTTDHAETFTRTDRNISSRPVSSPIDWFPANWPSVGARTNEQLTPDLRDLLQQIIDRPDWQSGNAIAFIISGSGVRTAESYDGDRNSAAELLVEYSSDGNLPPVARLIADPTGGDFPLTVNFDATASSDDVAISRYDWDFGDGVFVLDGAAQVSHQYIAPGTFTATLTVTDDTGKSSAAEIQIIAIDPNAPPPRTTRVYRVENGDDDAEERADFSMYLDSSDLELTEERDRQTIGIRFAGVDIPPTAIIRTAHLQFSTDETNSRNTNLSIAAHMTADAPAFRDVPGNISSRDTGVAVSWSPPAWSLTGERSQAQQSPSLAAIVQAVIDQPAWQSGNAIALVITGSGRRTAESFEGDSENAATLTIEYDVAGR